MQTSIVPSYNILFNIMDFESCLKKQKNLKNKFLSLSSTKECYEKIISLGRSLPPFPEIDRCEENLVKGCQSTLYIKIELKEKKLKISAESNALISLGLAALLISVFQDEPPEAIFKCPPSFINEIGLTKILSPTRSVGLQNLYKKLQKQSLKFIVF